MLKGLDPRLTPELLHLLALMGHGDTLAVVDRNYPAAATGQRVVRLDGLGLLDALDAVLTVFPIDTFVPEPVAAMNDVAAPHSVPVVQTEAFAAIERVEGRTIAVERVERFAFYQRVRGCFGVLTTTESRPYGCVILTKGVV